MSSAKEEILAAARAALEGAPEVSAPERAYRFASALDRDGLREQLVDRLVDYRANVVQVAQQDQIPAAVAGFLQGAKIILAPEGVGAQLLEEAEGQVLREEPLSPLSTAELDLVSAVVTESAAACSETGTIFLDGSADQGRRALTLVPDHHVVIVRMEKVRGLLPETLALLDPTRPLTWISGPSATSDIELERVEGVHGPRVLDVVLVG